MAEGAVTRTLVVARPLTLMLPFSPPDSARLHTNCTHPSTFPRYIVTPGSPWFNVVVVSIAGLTWLGLYFFFLPHYHALFNRIHIVASTCFVWAASCLALSQGDPDTDAALQLYMGMPFAAFTGLLLHDYRVARIVRSQPSALSSPYTVELRARFMVHTALYGHATDVLHPLEGDEAHGDGGGDVAPGAAAPRALPLSPLRSSGAGATVASLLRKPSTLRMQRPQKDARDDDLEELGESSHAAAAAQRPPSASSHPAGDADGGKGVPPSAPAASAGWGVGGGGEDDADDREQRALRVRRVLAKTSVVAEVHELYRAACSKFRASAMLHVFFSRFYATLAGNAHMQMSHLLQAERRRPGLDVAFLAFQARKTAEEASDDGSQLSALARVEFDKNIGDAQVHVSAAGKRQLAFFTELLGARPDLSRLHRLSSEMNDSVTLAEKAFAKVFLLNAQSLAAINLYAAFNQHVTCNVEKAFILAAEAERLNEVRERHRKLRSPATPASPPSCQCV